MKKWITPVLIKLENEVIYKTLSIESSLYASGCHDGMHERS